MPVKTISTQKAGQVLDVSHILLLGTSPVTIFDIEGESVSAGAALYIQLLGTAAPVSGTTVPLYSRLAVPAAASAGNNGFSFTYRPIGLDTSTMAFPESAILGGSNASPVYIAISSTDNVYTAVAASTQVTVDIEDTYLEIPNQVITGDNTTGVDYLAVYTDPNAAKRLVQFQVTNNNGATAYLQLTARVAGVDIPIQEWTLTSGQTLTQRFGSGWAIYSQDTNGVIHTGCYITGSSTPAVFTPTIASGWTMKAWNI